MDANDMKYFDPLLSSLGSGGDGGCGDDDDDDDGTSESFNRANEFEQKIREVCYKAIILSLYLNITFA